MKPYSLSVKVIITDSEGRCLLLKRSKYSKNNPGKWDLPGGKLELGERFEDAIIREVAEETGLAMQLTGLAGSVISENPSVYVVNVIMTGKVGDCSISLSLEHEEFYWFLPDQIGVLSMVEHLQRLTLDHFTNSDIDQSPLSQPICEQRG